MSNGENRCEQRDSATRKSTTHGARRLSHGNCPLGYCPCVRPTTSDWHGQEGGETLATPGAPYNGATSRESRVREIRPHGLTGGRRPFSIMGLLLPYWRKVHRQLFCLILVKRFANIASSCPSPFIALRLYLRAVVFTRSNMRKENDE